MKSDGPKKTDFRPLEAKTLKSMIDTLRMDLPDRRILDLYAGSGRFGKAALENAAASLIYVELDRARARDLKKLGVADGVVVADALDFLKKNGELYDLIFADPPYRIWNQELADALLDAASRRLTPGGILLVRYPKRVITSLDTKVLDKLGLSLWKESPQGESVLWYFSYEPKD